MRTSTVCVFTLIQLMCQEVYSDMQCVHNPAKLTTGINVSASRTKRHAARVEPFRVHFSYQDSGIGSMIQEEALERVLSDVQNFLTRALSVIPAASPILLGRNCVDDLIPVPVQERRTCFLQCERVTTCGPITIPESDLQGCDECNGNGAGCVQTSPDGPGVANADMVIYYTFGNTGACVSGRTIAFASACQLESELDRPVAGFIVFCLNLFANFTEEALFRISLHEVTHALAFSSGLYVYFHDEDGNPRNPRNQFGFLLSDVPSETTIRSETYTDWESVFGVSIPHTVSLMVTPNVIEQAGIQFGCLAESLLGVELENGGGGGTAGSHWEFRVMGVVNCASSSSLVMSVMQNEFMVGIIQFPSPISRITLGMLEDSGWYRPNYEVAEALAHGSQAGCRFPHSSCLEHINGQIGSGNLLRPFCNVLRGQPDAFLRCSTDRYYIAVCDLSELSFSLPLDNQYFTSGANFEAGQFDPAMIGGTSAVADHCPLHFPLLETSCSDITNQVSEALNIAGETHGANSKCFEHGRSWTQSVISSGTSTTVDRSAGCYEYDCGPNGVEIHFLGLRFLCQCEGEELVIDEIIGDLHYQGSLICPACGALCYDNLTLCNEEPPACPNQITDASTKEFVVIFENSSYGVLEDIGLDDFAVRVCFNVFNLTDTTTIQLTTQDGSATSGEDYGHLHTDIVLTNKRSRECVGIAIYEDKNAEMDEYFEVQIDEFGISTRVVILDDDDVSVRYTGSTLAVSGNEVHFNLEFGTAIVDATCQVLRGNRVQASANCFSGNVTFIILRSTRVSLTPSVIATSRRGTTNAEAVRDVTRKFRLGIDGRCSVHLINDGIISQINSSGEITFTIDWGLAAPSGVSEASGFACSLDNSGNQECMPPYKVAVASPGPHRLTVRPTETEGCNSYIRRNFDFEI